MTAPVPADGGAATGELGEEARRGIAVALAEGLFDAAGERGWSGGFLEWEAIAKEAAAILGDDDSPLRALIAQARAEGAAEERERIVGAIRRAEYAYEGYEHPESYRGGWFDGIGHAGDIIRGQQT